MKDYTKTIEGLNKIIKEATTMRDNLVKESQLFIDVPRGTLVTNIESKRVLEYLSDKRIEHNISKISLKETHARLNLIKSRLKESTYEEAIMVIDTRFIEWVNDEYYRKYLTVETMFKPLKYFKYVDAIEEILEKKTNLSWIDTDSEEAIKMRNEGYEQFNF